MRSLDLLAPPFRRHTTRSVSKILASLLSAHALGPPCGPCLARLGLGCGNLAGTRDQKEMKIEMAEAVGWWWTVVLYVATKRIYCKGTYFVSCPIVHLSGCCILCTCLSDPLFEQLYRGMRNAM